MFGSEVFSAGVQYNDFKGTVAADRSDNIALVDFLKGEGLAKENERIVGVRENPGNEMASPGVVAYLAEAVEDFSSPTTIRAIDIQISTAKLLSFFKRFDLVMTVGGEGFDAVPIEGPDY